MITKGILREYASLISITARVIDVFSVLIGGLISYAWYFDTLNLEAQYKIAILLGMAFTPIVFDFFRIYQSWRGKNQFNYYQTIITAWIVVVLMLLISAYITSSSENFSRAWLIAWTLCVTFIFIFSRFLFIYILRNVRSRGWNTRQIAIYGAGKLGQDVYSHIEEATWSGIKTVAFFDDDSSLRQKKIFSIEIKGGVEELCQYVAQKSIDEVWITLPLRSENRVKEIIDILQYSTVTIRYVPDIFGFRLLNHSVNEIAGIPVIDVSSTPMIGVNRIIKALEDRIIALIILILISPVLLLISLAVKLSSKGPVLFKQMRHGWDGKPIKVYKFRTMVVHNEENGIVTQAKKYDLRITKVGTFLRRTSLDELPQFFNVLQGRMSIVGPRPHAIQHNEYYKKLIDNYMKRHKVKPGITGWAQVNGYRGETDTLEKMQKRVEYDLFYIENWSFWFDIKIIFMTIFKGFTGKNAF